MLLLFAVVVKMFVLLLLQQFNPLLPMLLSMMLRHLTSQARHSSIDSDETAFVVCLVCFFVYFDKKLALSIDIVFTNTREITWKLTINQKARLF